jgi:hypothetical protein
MYVLKIGFSAITRHCATSGRAACGRLTTPLDTPCQTGLISRSSSSLTQVPDEYPHIEPFRRQIASEFILLQESPSLVPSANSAMAMALSGVGADDALPDGDGGAGKADGDVAASDDEDGSRKAAALNKIKHESKAAPVGPVVSGGDLGIISHVPS